MKYPLTDDAKVWARKLVEAWDSGEIEQRITIYIDGYRKGRVGGAKETFEQPPLATLWELEQCNLVDIRRYRTDTGVMRRVDSPAILSGGIGEWEVLFLQELRNAVKTGFEVSEYFLTMNAVGNIIINSQLNAPLQGTGVNKGVVSQSISMERLADDLVETLGIEFLDTQAELKEAIDALRTATDVDKETRTGGVISSLGRCMGHTSAYLTICQAIMLIGQYGSG